MNKLAIIPARYASTRFPGKPLTLIQSKPMIQHVYERALASGLFDKVVVAIDDLRIEQAVLAFSGEVVMTSQEHQSGTDRCGEVVKKMFENGNVYDIVVNIQGDEPYIHPEQLQSVLSCFSDSTTEIATLKKQILLKEDLLSPNIVKVVTDKNKNALYFSRLPIPFCRTHEEVNLLPENKYFKHIGLYAYRSTTLLELVKLSQSLLEKNEMLEQLRWLENGYKIKVETTSFESIAIDIPNDLLKLNTTAL